MRVQVHYNDIAAKQKKKQETKGKTFSVKINYK